MNSKSTKDKTDTAHQVIDDLKSEIEQLREECAENRAETILLKLSVEEKKVEILKFIVFLTIILFVLMIMLSLLV